MKLDAHQHFWHFDPVRDAWITEEMSVLRSDFLPEHLHPLLDRDNFDGSILVQSDQSEEGNNLMLRFSRDNSFIKGVVAWVDLASPDVEAMLEYYRDFPIIKGFRHILQGEKNRAKMLEPSFLRGVGLLKKFDFTYDILIYKDQLPYVPEFLNHFPDQRFVLDHIAKPDIKSGKIKAWAAGIREVSAFPNLYCKVSGMFVEADWNHWKRKDFTPYLDVILEAFGTKRIMFGSDWPVCLLATDYHEQLAITGDYFSDLSDSEKEGIFGKNAEQFYGIT